ncbi:hypothetical protein JIG36_32475 [Actinoplanes sp. LDG1-06]|uniref:Uncharacterized protein n=1 Tax=Paractinoplanes ovalisporus TaxID=2810368 RepID=A0ABS2AK96_9ACTN|nr:protealysin inhibitor emfourin [Actinoplanes ovalisporus]MBM2620242.1 hypothetical protein [Actinoplanes ovalisporus]
MSEHVRAELHRTGGFTGRPLHTVADSRSLPPPQSARLRQLLSTVDFTSLHGSAHPAAGADLFTYHLTLQRGDDHWKGTVSQASVPPALQPVLQFLVTVES